MRFLPTPAGGLALGFWISIVLFVWEVEHGVFGEALQSLAMAAMIAVLFGDLHSDWREGNAVSETLP